MRWIWLGAGGIAVALGALGVILPGLPTVPFLLLAAFCFARGSTRAHDWLINHRIFGPPIADWQKSGAIRPAAKRAATIAVALTFGISIWLALPLWGLIGQACILSLVLLFIWTRPSQ